MWMPNRLKRDKDFEKSNVSGSSNFYTPVEWCLTKKIQSNRNKSIYVIKMLKSLKFLFRINHIVTY